MKFLHFFRKKERRAVDQFDPDQTGKPSEKPGEPKEKILYGPGTSLMEVLNYIKENSFDIGIQLNKPATNIEIEAFENQKTAMPYDFKLLYKLSNGFETDHDLFRLIPLHEIMEDRSGTSDLISDTSFHFTEYMIYSDRWGVDINKENVNDYGIYNMADSVVYLTNSLTEFLCVFINKGIYDGLYEWQERKQRPDNC